MGGCLTSPFRHFLLREPDRIQTLHDSLLELQEIVKLYDDRKQEIGREIAQNSVKLKELQLQYKQRKKPREQVLNEMTPIQARNRKLTVDLENLIQKILHVKGNEDSVRDCVNELHTSFKMTKLTDNLKTLGIKIEAIDKTNDKFEGVMENIREVTWAQNDNAAINNSAGFSDIQEELQAEANAMLEEIDEEERLHFVSSMELHSATDKTRLISNSRDSASSSSSQMAISSPSQTLRSDPEDAYSEMQ